MEKKKKKMKEIAHSNECLQFMGGGSERESNFVIVRHGSTSKNRKHAKNEMPMKNEKCRNAKFIELN